MKMTKKKKKSKVKATNGFKERYNSLPQKKQRFKAGNTEVLIEVKPYPTSTVYGNGRLFMVAYVFLSDGIGVKGEAIFNPDDKVFDFRFGAEMALERALETGYTYFDLISDKKIKHSRIVDEETRKAIWNEFNKLLPK